MKEICWNNKILNKNWKTDCTLPSLWSKSLLKIIIMHYDPALKIVIVMHSFCSYETLLAELFWQLIVVKLIQKLSASVFLLNIYL